MLLVFSFMVNGRRYYTSQPKRNIRVCFDLKFYIFIKTIPQNGFQKPTTRVKKIKKLQVKVFIYRHSSQEKGSNLNRRISVSLKLLKNTFYHYVIDGRNELGRCFPSWKYEWIMLRFVRDVAYVMSSTDTHVSDLYLRICAQ